MPSSYSKLLWNRSGNGQSTDTSLPRGRDKIQHPKSVDEHPNSSQKPAMSKAFDHDPLIHPVVSYSTPTNKTAGQMQPQEPQQPQQPQQPHQPHQLQSQNQHQQPHARNRAPQSTPVHGHVKDVTSVVFIGNPGVGKSALLSALGGKFNHGYHQVSGLTTDVSEQYIELGNSVIRLVDMPGIYDAGEGRAEEIIRHLQMLHSTLNDGSPFLVFFVISPRNGRVDNADLAVMKLVMDNIEQGPFIGLILTQIRKRDYEKIQSPSYTALVLKLLEGAECENLRFIDRNSTLVLVDHEDTFSPEEVTKIKKYVLSFKPKKVVIHDMVAAIVARYLEMLKRVF
ncbi:hypothetical protein EMPS_09416 [Entomortierella parvispora]|uniref:G domain-containing protein n=1 Tax=Entomortierella parvispora TaxID=205924 RepID=A0A9P3HIS6_9FUNG|nr:hypothetical protein EMPS_09416 [Entomortierella parvispora]